MSRKMSPRAEQEDGFTLIELVISVSMLGIIVAPLAGIVLSYLRTTVETQARLTESHDVQLAAAYWQRDVASIGVRSSTYDSATHSFPLQQSVDIASCPLPAGATAVVTLAWSEYNSLTSTAPPSTAKVTYAARPVGGVHELLRIRCGSVPSIVAVADTLAEPPSLACLRPDGGGSCTGDGSQVPAVVRLRLRVRDPLGGDPDYIVTLTGERRQS